MMGADIWRDAEEWPLPDTQYRRYLHSHGRANTLAGDVLSLIAREPADSFCYDPRNPVPNRRREPAGEDPRCSGPVPGINARPLDQSRLSSAKMLCYTTRTAPAAAGSDRPGHARACNRLIGAIPISPASWWMYHPDGRAEILADGILRALSRAGGRPCC